MAQVPYSPVPSIAPTEAATPGVRENAPEAAFGGATAQALGNLGKVVEGAGNELFHRAVAMQQLNNETEAKNADVAFMLEAGDLHAKYNELQGQERVNAFKGYSQSLQDLYQKHRGGLSNPMAQRMFDSSAISTMSRSIFNGAGAAATAGREASLGAANAEFDLTVKGVYNDPNDVGAYNDAIARSDAAAVNKAALSPGGASPERVALLKQQGRSTITYNRIIGMAANQPNQAYELLKDAEAKGMIFGPQDVEATNKVRSFIHSTGMNTVADQTLGKYVQPDGTYSKSVQDMSAEAVDQAKKLYPEDPQIAMAAEQALKRNFSTNAWNQTMDERARKQEVSNYIVKGAMDTNMLPPDLVKRMTPAEIKAFPANANAYKRAETVQTNEKQYRDLLGLYNNDNGAFMDKNIYAEPGISKGNIDFFVGLQRKAAANGDPRVARAMKQLQGASPQILDDLGVTGPNKDRATSNQFVGALHEAIQSYQETNGKPPDEKTITDTIFPAITRQVTSQGWLWNSQVPFFSAPIPDKYKELATKAVGRELSELELRQAYSRQIFDQFFKGQKTSKDQSRAGQ